MFFMWQEFLEDKQCSDNLEFHQNLLSANSLVVFAR
jgi:hypothetical protein